MFREYQENGKIYFPIKANDDSLIISSIIEMDGCFEVDSREHIDLLLNVYNVCAEKLLYSYPIREIKDIKFALDKGVRLFVIDSVEEYEKIVSLSSEVKFVIRINVLQILNNTLSAAQDKWGLSLSEATELIKKMRTENIKVSGISFYITSEVEQENAFEIVLNTLISNFKETDIEFVNLGGGISLEKINDIKYLLSKIKLELKAKYIVFEPGRNLLNPCIELAVSVTAIRYSNGNRLVFINAGIYNGLIDAIVKRRKYNIVDKKQNNLSELCISYVCGSSSDISDNLGDYELRADLAVGDMLYIQECGAYSSVMHTHFYGKKHAPMIIKEED